MLVHFCFMLQITITFFCDKLRYFLRQNRKEKNLQIFIVQERFFPNVHVYLCVTLSLKHIPHRDRTLKLSCTLPCEQAKVMVFCHSLSGLTCDPLSGPLRCVLFPWHLLWRDWSWQALTFRNVPINGFHGCSCVVSCWYTRRSPSAVGLVLTYFP